MPTRPNRIDDWGAPALSTRKMRVFSTGGALGILTAGTGLGFHPASSFSILARNSASRMSPATTSTALLGR